MPRTEAPLDTLTPAPSYPRLAALALAAANLVPLAGVIFWGWDAFLLLVLYWAETAAFGFWTILQIMLLQFDGTSRLRGALAALGLGAFFTVHAGLFMTVHMIFLWALFAGPWAARVHGPGDFIRVILIGAGLWIPFAALFLARGALTFNDAINRFVFARGDRVTPAGDAQGNILGRFYGRIVLMHLAILLGGMAAMRFGTLAPLVILILAKTALDLKLATAAKPRPVDAPAAPAP
jgi:hypothetical protein